MHVSSSLIQNSYFIDIPNQLVLGLPENDSYELRFASNQSELLAAQRLRYHVFNQELNEGLASSHLTGLDQDEFDHQCFHLFVRHKSSGDVVGTYRLQTLTMATKGNGFYSATLFDFSNTPSEIIEKSVELGRACIHPNHRSLIVLNLLWKGVGHFARFFEKTYLFGCCSLTSQDEAEGHALFQFLQNNAHIHSSLQIPPLGTHSLSSISSAVTSAIKPPRLMRAYLSLGAKICSPPAIDREFKTIDFLAMFDCSLFDVDDSAFYHLRP